LRFLHFCCIIAIQLLFIIPLFACLFACLLACLLRHFVTFVSRQNKKKDGYDEQRHRIAFYDYYYSMTRDIQEAKSGVSRTVT